MKIIGKTGMLFIVLNLWSLLQPTSIHAQASVNFQVFYDNLSPYGSWMRNPSYGYVWVPQVTGFTPYHTNGYWVYTDFGWTWVSNYSWGWAPFHYGRWYYDPYYSWVWVPDEQWGPAWVSWRSSPDYYGWAPMAPGISLTTAYSSNYRVPNTHWTFVRNSDFGRTNITNYYVNNSSNTTIVSNTRVINNIRKDNTRNVSYALGPDKNDVQKRTGRSYTAVALKDRNEPGQKSTNNELQLFRPKVQKTNSSANQPRPAKVAEMKDTKDTKRQQPVNVPKTDPTRGTINADKPKNQPQRPIKSIEPKSDAPQNQPQRPVRDAAPRVNNQPSQPQRPVIKNVPDVKPKEQQERINERQNAPVVPQQQQRNNSQPRQSTPAPVLPQRGKPENQQQPRNLQPGGQPIQRDHKPGNILKKREAVLHREQKAAEILEPLQVL
jgi:hypothetical protein